jgi:peroxiredoxin
VRKLWTFAAAGALALALVTIALRWPLPGGPPPDPSACPVDAAKANLGFTLKDLKGRDVRLADYRGKVLLLDFWATWCGPCQIEIPGFVDLYARYGPRGFEVVGVVVLDEFANAGPFAEQFKMNYPILNGTDRQDIEDAFGPLFALPTSFLIGRDGRICGKHIGLPPHKSSTGPVEKAVRDVFEAEIRSLLEVFGLWSLVSGGSRVSGLWSSLVFCR